MREKSNWLKVVEIFFKVEAKAGKLPFKPRGFSPQELAKFLLSECSNHLAEEEKTFLKSIGEAS